MAWQTVDWFIALIFVFFIAAIVLGFFRRRRRGKAETQRPGASEKEDERPGPTINM